MTRFPLASNRCRHAAPIPEAAPVTTMVDMGAPVDQARPGRGG